MMQNYRFERDWQLRVAIRNSHANADCAEEMNSPETTDVKAKFRMYSKCELMSHMGEATTKVCCPPELFGHPENSGNLFSRRKRHLLSTTVPWIDIGGVPVVSNSTSSDIALKGTRKKIFKSKHEW